MARQLLVLQVAIVGVVVVVGAVLVFLDEWANQKQTAADTVTGVAVTLSDLPDVRRALTGADPSSTLQPIAEEVRTETHVDFITIMAPDGMRFTHPNPAEIGKVYIGSTDQARAGRVYTETFTGTLGESVRTIAPVFDAKHEVIGMVSVGITITAITDRLTRRLGMLTLIALSALCVGIGGSWLVSARLRRQTRGVAPAELSRMFDYYDATLHAFREGLLLVTPDGRIVLCNNAAKYLLGIDGDPATVADLGVTAELAVAMTGSRAVVDEIHVADARVIVVNAAPVHSRGAAMGNVVTLRDHTQLLELAGELDSVRRMADALHAHAHESANRLHTVVSLVELGRPDRAVEFATTEMRTAQALTDHVVEAVAEPAVAALLLGKSAEAHERGADLVITDDTDWDGQGALDATDLIAVLGNLVDNALDAACEHTGSRTDRPTVRVTVRPTDSDLVIVVWDNGPGVDPAALPKLCERGWSTKTTSKPGGRGLGLALVQQIVKRNGGSLGVSRDVGAVFTVRLPLVGRA